MRAGMGMGDGIMVVMGIMVILVWVDDMSLAYSNRKMFATFKVAYQNTFPSKFALRRHWFR